MRSFRCCCQNRRQSDCKGEIAHTKQFAGRSISGLQVTLHCSRITRVPWRPDGYTGARREASALPARETLFKQLSDVAAERTKSPTIPARKTSTG